MRLDRLSISIIALASLALAGACGDPAVDEASVSMERDAESAAKTVRDNAEDAARTNDETYDEERAEGEGRLEAAGDAYDAVEEQAK